MKRAGLALLFLLAAAPYSRGQEAIYIVRHAERADQSGDSPLSADGEARAVRLADRLRAAGITHIYTTDLRRTVQTAMPLAATSHLTPQQLPSADVQRLGALLRRLGPRDRALVVGHSNTVPELLTLLGAEPPVTIGDAEFDNLFIVVPQKGRSPVLLRLKY